MKHKQKGESVLKFAALMLSKLVLCILHSLPAILFIYCREKYFFKSKSIGDVTLHEVKGLHVCLYCVQ